MCSTKILKNIINKNTKNTKYNNYKFNTSTF